MHRPAILVLASLTSVTAPLGSADPPGPGVSLTLAEDRAARLRDVRYRLHLTIPDELETPVSGSVTVRFGLTDASRPLALDFAGPAAAIRAVHMRERIVPAAIRDEHIILGAADLREGDNEVTLTFDASDVPLNRSREFMYTLFVPARARLAFPCFDQPDVKARYEVSLDIPAGWNAVTNGTEVSRQESRTGSRLAFAETAPISTYLFAVAAGRFSVESADRNGRRFRMLHRETDRGKVARNRDAVFDLHAAALDWMEHYTGIPYPFGKFDFLLVPSFQFSGMEHPGAVFYNASALLLDPSATQNQELGRASLIAHETAHMWFGDLVTMKWFDDVWMKEVFANFMAARIVNPSFPGINHDLRFLYAHYPAAYEVDRTAGTNPVRQWLDNLNEAGSLYGAIIYQKAPIVMRQLEMIVTPEGLRDGLREYLRQHAYGNATWPDLIRLLDRRTTDDLEAWSRTWVSEAGRPIVTTTDVRVRGRTFRARFTQSDPVPARGLTWPQRIHLVAGYPEGELVLKAGLAGSESTITGTHDRSAGPPLYLLPTGGGLAYGEFVLDPASRAYLTSKLHDVPDALTRGAALVTLWEDMLGGRTTPATMFDLLVTSLPTETDELSVQRMLSYAQQAFWKFLPPHDRDRRAPGLERVLRRGLAAASTSSVKSAWFNALRDTARTPGTVEWLGRVWKRTETVPGLTLAEPDYIRLALELTVRQVPSWEQILDEQSARIENPDRKDQFEFVRPALAADAAVRGRFFEGLRDGTNRRREAWVIQAIGYLHHPLRARAAERHLPASLALLREIQQTGDIFFPKRWMDATLSGHQSASAARMVTDFVEQLPKDYPDRLRRVILASADDLFRASRLQDR